MFNENAYNYIRLHSLQLHRTKLNGCIAALQAWIVEIVGHSVEKIFLEFQN